MPKRNIDIDLSDLRIGVWGGTTGGGIAVTRSLSSSGAQVLTIEEETSTDLVVRSIRRVLRPKGAFGHISIPDSRNSHATIKILGEIFDGYKLDILIPVGTKATNFLSMFRNELGKKVRCLVPHWTALEPLHDKLAFTRRAEDLGILIPKTFPVGTKQDLAVAIDNLKGRPVLVKPVDSYSSRGIWLSDLEGEELIEEFIVREGQLPLEPNLSDGASIIIQERIAGSISDSLALVRNGEPLMVMTQARIKTAWLNGGGGTVTQTTDESDIREMTLTLLKGTGYTGPIQLEWIREYDSGDAYILEANTKFWGTSAACIAAGYNVPALAVAEEYGKNYSCPTCYNVGTWHRFIFPEVISIATYCVSRRQLLTELGGFLARFRIPHCNIDPPFLEDFRGSLGQVLVYLYRILRGAPLRRFLRLLICGSMPRVK